MKIAIIDYGSGNVRSVQFALKRLKVESFVTSQEEEILTADKVIFPGVGTAGHVMQGLKKKNLDQLIPQLKQPVLGICVGMQLMCSSSEENHTKGFGIFPIDVNRFKHAKKVPHMGWNSIQELKSPLMKNMKEDSFVYYVHSYYAPVCEFTIATTFYQSKFSAVLNRDNFYGCQFHPEKSGAIGHQLLKNFLFEDL